MEIERLGKYEIRGTLGKGAMGTVYEGWDPIISRKVAIKTVRMPETSDIEAQEELQRFKREAQAAGRLTHPNIVGIFDYGETDQVAYIVMEYVDGRTVKSILDSAERMPVGIVARVMADMLAGLHYSHERGVIHRDIKPANIMITKEGHAKIADFGIARIESSSLTQTGTIMGTPAYMSPEQFMGQTVDATTDIYSAGVLLFQLLTGERPFEGSMATIMHRVLNTVPPKPSELSVTAPVNLDAVVARAMAKRPEDRYPNAAAFAEALRSALDAPPGARTAAGPVENDATIIASGGAKPAAPGPAPAKGQPGPFETQVRPPVETPAKSRSRTPVVVGGVVLALALGGGGAWFALSGAANNPEVANPVASPSASSPTPVAHVEPTTPVARIEPPAAPVPPTLPSTPAPTPPTARPSQANPTVPSQAEAAFPASPALAAAQPQVTQVVPPQVTPPTAPAGLSAPFAPVQSPRPVVTNTPIQPPTIVPPAPNPVPRPAVADTPSPAVAPATRPLPAPVIADLPRPPAAATPAPAPLTAPITQPAPTLALTAPAAITPPSPASSSPSPALVTAPPATVPVATPPANLAPTVVASAGLSPEALRRAIGGVVASADCAVVTGDIANQARGVELRGVIGRGAPEQNLQRAVRDVAPTAAVDWGLGVLDGPYCPALNLVRAYVPAFGTFGAGVQLGLKGDQTSLVEGDKVELRARAPSFPSYLEIDYLSNDGSVAHLNKAAAGAPPVQPGVTREMLAGEVGPPYGTDLIIAVAASAPLFTRDQALAENTTDYLRELRAALDSATRRGTRVAIGVLMVHTSPKS